MGPPGDILPTRARSSQCRGRDVVDLSWWHWVAFGLLLIAAELFVPSFTIIWFGAGACLVGLLVLLFPALPLAAQIFLWAAFSVVFTVLWFRVFRPRMVDQTTSGMSK